jgi:hypothetical protein
MNLSLSDKGRRRPWSSLSPDLATVLEPAVPATVDAIVAEVAAGEPEYRAGMSGPFGVALRRGVEIALARWLALFGTDEPALAGTARIVYERIGAGESDEGRSLEALLAAYRTGARVVWEKMAAAASASGISTADLVTLAEAIFVYIDELSASSVEGYASEQAAEAGYRDVVRSRLAQMLIDGESARQPDTVRQLADAAAWAVPDRLAVAVIPRPAESSGRRLPPAPPDALLLERGPDILAVVPDPSGPGRRERLTAGLGDAEVYVGTVRPLHEAALSLAHARRVRRLVEAGIVPPGTVVAAADWLPEMVVAADDRLLSELASRVLAPLAAVPASRRQVLLDTLRAWLDHHGDRQAVAATLVVHPQTVSYRLARLNALLGAGLQEPHTRFALRLALTPHRAA